MTRLPWRVAAVVGLAAVLLHARPATAQLPAAGDAHHGTVVGVVMLDNAPLAGVVVTLGGPRLMPPRAPATDRAGAFAFTDLPAGDFHLTLQRAPYVLAAVGAVAWTGDEVPVSVAAGQTIDLSLVVARGGAVEGTIRDPFGQPLPGAAVSVFRRRLDPSLPRMPPIASVTTDGRGQYRAYGLPSSEYVIQASATASSNATGIELVDDADFRRAEQAARESRRLVLPDRRAPETVQYVSMYFGGTSSEGDALGVVLDPGREQRGIDIQLGLSQTVTLRGLVTLSDGRPAPAVRLLLLPVEPGRGANGPVSVTVDGRGAFARAGVAPGRYRLVAEATHTAGDSPGAERGAVDIQVPGSETSDIRLVMARPVRLEGRLILDRVEQEVTQRILPGARVALQRIGGGMMYSSLDVAHAQVTETGAFAFDDVLPGDYGVSLSFANTSDIEVPGIERIRFGDTTLADGVVPVTASASGALELHLSTRQAELSGTVSGWPKGLTSRLSVLVFPADAAAWRRASERVRLVQVQESGRYRVGGLPAGTYLVAVVSGTDVAGVVMRSTFDEASGFATRIQIDEGVARTLDLRADAPSPQ